MVLYIIIGTLAAFGLTCLGSLLRLWFSRRKPGLAFLCLSKSPRQELWAIGKYRRLLGLGILKCPLWVVDSHLSPAAQIQLEETYPDIHFFTKEEFSLYDPTGT